MARSAPAYGQRSDYVVDVQSTISVWPRALNRRRRNPGADEAAAIADAP
jgi:hypothetical protein